MELVESYVRNQLHDVCGYLVMPGDVVRFRVWNGIEQYYAVGEYVDFDPTKERILIKWQSKQVRPQEVHVYDDETPTYFSAKNIYDFKILTRYGEPYRGLSSWS